jgi:hypothetical protein
MMDKQKLSEAMTRCDDLFERSKNDGEIISGSEIRHVCSDMGVIFGLYVGAVSELAEMDKEIARLRTDISDMKDGIICELCGSYPCGCDLRGRMD